MLKYWPYFLLLLANLIYGLNYSIAKEVMPQYIEPMGFVLLRALTAMVFFWTFNLFLPSSKDLPFSRKDWYRILACAFFGICLNQLAFFKGLNLTAPISSSIIMTSVPIIVLVLSYLILHNPITPVKIIGVIAGLIGALLIIFSSQNTSNIKAPNPLLGNTLIMLNATSYSLYLILAKPLLKKYRPMRILKWLFTFGFIMILPFGYEELKTVDWNHLPPKIIAAIAFVLLFVSCLTYLFNLSALKRVNPSTVSIFIYSQPIFAIAFSLYLKNDSLNFMKICGAILIFIGVYFVISSNFKIKKI